MKVFIVRSFLLAIASAVSEEHELTWAASKIFKVDYGLTDATISG